MNHRLITEQFGLNGFVVLNDAKGVVTGPFRYIEPVGGEITIEEMKISGVSAADVTALIADSIDVGIFGTINEIHVSAGKAIAYKASTR